MNWIRIARNIKNDPRILTLAARCRVRVPEAVGLVVSLLVEFPDNAPDGTIVAIEDFVLEQWAGWSGDMGVFAEHFRALLCDETGTVRAWEKHNGAAMREAEAARDRAKRAREEARRRAEEERAAEQPPARPTKPRRTRVRRLENSSANERRTVGDAFASNGTERDVTSTPSSPDGSERPPSPPEPNGSAANVLFAEWEKHLFAAAQPHEVAALEHLARTGFRPAIIGELYAIATGHHVVRGEHNPRAADASDVMRAVAELACKPARDWDQSYFRGCVRRVIDRPPEPPDAETREQLRLERAARALPTASLIETPRTPAEIEAGRARREQAMQHFRNEARKNSQPAAA